MAGWVGRFDSAVVIGVFSAVEGASVYLVVCCFSLAGFNKIGLYLHNQMDRGQTDPTVVYNLRNRQQFRLKSAIIGCCLGGGTAIGVGGPLAQQLVQAAVLTVTIGAGIYWLLLALAAAVTDDAGDYVVPNRPESTHPTTSQPPATK